MKLKNLTKLLTLSLAVLNLIVFSSCEKEDLCKTYFWIGAEQSSEEVAKAAGDTLTFYLSDDWDGEFPKLNDTYWLDNVTVNGEKVDISSLGNRKQSTVGNFTFKGEWYTINRISDTTVEVVFEKNETAKTRYLEIKMKSCSCSGTASLRQKSH